MKTAIILFNNPECPLNGDLASNVIDAYLSGGVSIHRLEVLSVNDDIAFKRSVEYFKDTTDNLIIINNSELSFNAKQILADIMDSALAENDEGVKFLQAVSNAHNKDYPIENAIIPIDATLIPNINGAFQSFLLEKDGFTVVMLPQDYSQLKLATDRYILPYFEEKFEISRMRLTLKYFGDGTALEKVLIEAKNISDKPFTYSIIDKNGDYTVDILLEDKSTANQTVRYIIEQLKEGIYAEYDASLGEILFNHLRLRKLKLATAESFTGGRVVSSVIANSGASQFVHEGIVCYSNESKSSRLGIPLSEISRDGAVSSMTAYKMASGLLKDGKCDIAISTTGVAGPNPDGDKPVGLAYIGIGMMDGIHTYKLNLNGSREQITERAKNTALFLAIKKIKNIR